MSPGKHWTHFPSFSSNNKGPCDATSTSEHKLLLKPNLGLPHRSLKW